MQTENKNLATNWHGVPFIYVAMFVSVYLLTWLMRRVWSKRSLPGRRLSQIRCWLERTATPWHTHSEHNTSRTWAEDMSAASICRCYMMITCKLAARTVSRAARGTVGQARQLPYYHASLDCKLQHNHYGYANIVDWLELKVHNTKRVYITPALEC